MVDGIAPSRHDRDDRYDAEARRAEAARPPKRIEEAHDVLAPAGDDRPTVIAPEAFAPASAIATLRGPELQAMQELYGELARLGDQRGCRSDDTLDRLIARRDTLLAAKRAEWIEAREERAYMDDSGGAGTLSELRARDVLGRVEAANPGTGTGALLAGIASAQGADLREIRAAGERGAMVEGLGGGLGAAYEAQRAIPVEEGALREARRGSLDDVAEREVRPIEPSRSAESDDWARIETRPAAPSAPRTIRATFDGRIERIAHERFTPEDRAKIDALLAQRSAARAKLDALERAGAPRAAIDRARYAMGRVSEQIGEVAAEATVRAKFPGPPAPQRLWPPPGGQARRGEFDQVWRVVSEGKPAVAVVEAKGGSGRLGTRAIGPSDRAQQGTKEYFGSLLDTMSRNPASLTATMAVESSTRVLYVEVKTPIRESGGTSSASVTTVRRFDLGGQREAH